VSQNEIQFSTLKKKMADEKEVPRYCGPALVVPLTLKEMQPPGREWDPPPEGTPGMREESWDPRITYRGLSAALTETLTDAFGLFEEEADDEDAKGFMLVSNLPLFFRTQGRTDPTRMALFTDRCVERAENHPNSGELAIHLSRFLEVMDAEQRTDAVELAQGDADRLTEEYRGEMAAAAEVHKARRAVAAADLAKREAWCASFEARKRMYLHGGEDRSAAVRRAAASNDPHALRRLLLPGYCAPGQEEGQEGGGGGEENEKEAFTFEEASSAESGDGVVSSRGGVRSDHQEDKEGVTIMVASNGPDQWSGSHWRGVTPEAAEADPHVLARPLAGEGDGEQLASLHQLATERHPRHRGRVPDEAHNNEQPDAALVLASLPPHFEADQVPLLAPPWQRTQTAPATLALKRRLMSERESRYAPWLPPIEFWDKRSEEVAKQAWVSEQLEKIAQGKQQQQQQQQQQEARHHRQWEVQAKAAASLAETEALEKQNSDLYPGELNPNEDSVNNALLLLLANKVCIHAFFLAKGLWWVSVGWGVRGLFKRSVV
jgi:hypothetical protein